MSSIPVAMAGEASMGMELGVPVSPEFVWDRVQKHDRDLYEGNGKPSLTSRMTSAEDRLDRCEERDEKIASNINKGIWLVVATIVTMVANICVTLITLLIRHN